MKEIVAAAHPFCPLLSFVARRRHCVGDSVTVDNSVEGVPVDGRRTHDGVQNTTLSACTYSWPPAVTPKHVLLIRRVAPDSVLEIFSIAACFRSLSTPFMRASTRSRCMATEVGTYRSSVSFHSGTSVREHEFLATCLATIYSKRLCHQGEAALFGGCTPQETTHNIVVL